MITKILAAYDGSEPAGHAYRFALDLAKRYGADRWCSPSRVHPSPPRMSRPRPSSKAPRHTTKELFDVLKAQAAKEGLKPRFEVAAGHAANQIVYGAEHDGIDLIVVGHRGKSFFEQLLVGSVSKQVVTHAHCPVLVVRCGKTRSVGWISQYSSTPCRS